MGETSDYLENNVEELGNEAAGFASRFVEYKPDIKGIHSYGHPKENETVMHFNIGTDRPACHLRRRFTKWQMTGTKKKVTCKNCKRYFKELR